MMTNQINDLRAPVQALDDSANVFLYLRRYFQDHPTEAALWCFGAGFLIGWKLKPW